MKKKTYKIIICIGLVMMIFANFSSVFGAINDSYKKNTKVTDSALDSKIQGSALLDILANMINAVASLAETLIGNVFQVLTKDKIFPWADRIIFNSIEFLDINFLNPAPNSLFGTSSSPSVLGKVVKRVYSTIFSLAILFLGVAVGVMAIRLAISSIAAEKARYKQAIVNWATCIVMLFLMHYTLAFIFWINEQLVEIASNILIQTIKDENLGNVSFLNALDVKAEDRIKSFKKLYDDQSPSVMEILSTGIIRAVKLNSEHKTALNYAKAADKILDKYPDMAANLLTNPVYTPGAYSGKQASRRIANEDVIDEKKWYQVKEPIYMATIAAPVLAHDTYAAAAIEALNKNNKKQYDEQKKKGYFSIGQPEGTGEDHLLGRGDTIFLDETTFKNSSEYTETLKMIYVSLVKSSQNVFDYDSEKPWYDPEAKFKKFDYYGYFKWAKDNWGSKVDEFKNEKLDNKNDDFMNCVNSVKYSKKELEKKLGSEICNQAVKYRMDVDKAIYDASMGKQSLSTSAQDIIASLGSFFKQSAYVYKTETTTDENGDDKETVTGWRASQVSVTGALLYGIFIFQSCMYLVTYVKRLFYVMMLSMFGPIVVIYDFFIKSAS